MKVFFVLFFVIIILWPVLTWISYYVAGWKKWESLFRRDVTHDTDTATSVGLKKF
ncbi:hypothetical protein H6768_05030 [Candidatus Peribacteria bacterium]|nr:hypothetical protein [Candidatus Peribacteria bacterium]